MTIEKAVDQLLKTEKFAKDARKDARLRVFQQRHREGSLGKAAALAILVKYKYKIEVIEP